MPKQHTIDSILQQLAEFRLPVLCDREQLKQQIKSDSASATSIARWSARAPVFSLYAQLQAGEANKGKSGEVSGPEHAMSMLGMQGLASLADKLVEFVPEDSDSLTDFRQVMAESVLASLIALQLAKMKGLNTAENQAAALFARAAEWVTYWIAPRRSWQVRRMYYRKPFSQSSISELILGFRYSVLQQAMVEQFHMPSLNYRVANFSMVAVAKDLVAAVRLFRANDLRLEELPRTLRFQIGSVEALPVIANKLAQSLCSPWLRNNWGYWSDIAAIHCHSTNRSVTEKVLEAVRQCELLSVDFNQYPLASGLVQQPSDTPYHRYLADRQAAKQKAQQMIEQRKIAAAAKPRENPIKKEAIVTRKKSVTKQESATETEGFSFSIRPVSSVDDEFAEYTKQDALKVRQWSVRLQKKTEQFSGIQQAVTQTVQCILKFTPFSRAAFLMLDFENGRLKPMICRQVERGEEPFKVAFTLKQSPILKRMMDKQTFVQFNHQKHAKVWSQFSSVITNRAEYFLLNSLFYRGKVRAFLYADMAPSNKPVSAETLQDFKRLSVALSAAMSQLSVAKKPSTGQSISAD